ncbi:MAG: hypothetical protein ACAH59_02260 [Pseudobdellovibrionaceae bacterium]
MKIFFIFCFGVLVFVACDRESSSVQVNGIKEKKEDQFKNSKNGKMTKNLNNLEPAVKKAIKQKAEDVKALIEIFRQSESMYIQVLRVITEQENYQTLNVFGMVIDGLSQKNDDESGFPYEDQKVPCKKGLDFDFKKPEKSPYYYLMARNCGVQQPGQQFPVAYFQKKDATHWKFGTYPKNLRKYIGEKLNHLGIAPKCDFTFVVEEKTALIQQLNCQNLAQELSEPNYMKISQFVHDRNKKDKPTTMKWDVINTLDSGKNKVGLFEDFAYDNKIKIKITGVDKQEEESADDVPPPPTPEEMQAEEASPGAGDKKNGTKGKNPKGTNEVTDSHAAAAAASEGLAPGEISGEYVGDQHAEEDPQFVQPPEGEPTEDPNQAPPQPDSHFEAADVPPEAQT